SAAHKAPARPSPPHLGRRRRAIRRETLRGHGNPVSGSEDLAGSLAVITPAGCAQPDRAAKSDS
ncbi:MAG: hypothetical protein WCY32_05145, partial [Burkholderiaceae bacterium]